MSIHLKFANNGRKTTHIKVLHGKLDLELPIGRHVKELPWQYHIIDKLKTMDSHSREQNNYFPYKCLDQRKTPHQKHHEQNNYFPYTL